MIKLFYIILGSIIILALILIIGNIYYTKYQFSIAKIKEAEKEIQLLLEKKLTLLKEIAPLIKKELKLKKFLDSLNQVEEENPNNFERNNLLIEKYKRVLKKMEENEKLYKSEDIVNLLNSLKDNEIELSSTIKFYNDTLVFYNKLIISFPSNIFGFFFRYHKKQFYNQPKKEAFEILKEEIKENQN